MALNRGHAKKVLFNQQNKMLCNKSTDTIHCTRNGTIKLREMNKSQIKQYVMFLTTILKSIFVL